MVSSPSVDDGIALVVQMSSWRMKMRVKLLELSLVSKICAIV